MAASSQIGNIDQDFFLFNLFCKIVDFEAFLGPERVEPQEDIQKQLCPVMIFNPNQSFGNRAMMIMMYYWRFWEPCANAMLVVLQKLWFWIENHDWHNSFWMSSWGSPL